MRKNSGMFFSFQQNQDYNKNYVSLLNTYCEIYMYNHGTRQSRKVKRTFTLSRLL